jgi:hypothetical protein
MNKVEKNRQANRDARARLKAAGLDSVAIMVHRPTLTALTEIKNARGHNSNAVTVQFLIDLYNGDSHD